MKVTVTSIPDVLILEPRVFQDSRGIFFESFNECDFIESTGLLRHFVQDNHSMSYRRVLRGMHYQSSHAQGKLVRVAYGGVFDVVVDMRRNSPSLGKWVGVHLSSENKKQLWIPEGFAHGFLVLSERAEFVYKVTNYQAPKYECCLRWDDPIIGIDWPLAGIPIVSERDSNGSSFEEAVLFDM